MTDPLLERIKTDWQRVHPDLDSRPMLMPIVLGRLQQALSRRVEATYRKHGLNPANWDLLLTLRRSAPAEGLTPGELTELTAVSGPSMTNRVDKLVDKGLVERNVSVHDRRSWRVRLTGRGRALVDELLPQHVENEARVLSALSAPEVRELERIALKLLRALE